ncbi:retrotransposon hot spot (RHS) protein, putative [Trypanosoma cruzi marinkellei]|uniref:Retrotransposon hot spot (RHS) protein, putative n=1 Tax=Trypanosoma cruzi marinkellei TaxID=85056 RepID=K2NRE3_TRYCR|nr:retrotransposon hot spot (RHS) protein, putative [Trypanosoma cruzi marinkellei]
MPPKLNKVQGGDAKNPASAVPQGGPRRRTRQELEGDTDQPAATHIRVEEARQPQWTMRSTVEEILLEGSTNRAEMRLNDFLRSNVGGRAAVDEDHNVTMEMFVLTPTMFIQDEGLLGLITALSSYQELKMVLEAISKLHLEAVVSLEQWRDYEGKDTVTYFARRKINRVLNQVLSEERRKAEARAEREKQVRLTVTTTIEDALFRGRVRVMHIKLNDFLTMELDGKGILRANRNVILKDFLNNPTSHIQDEGVLREIQAAGRYVRMERAVKEEVIFEEDVRKLLDNGVDNILRWSLAASEVKASVCGITKNSLDAAAEEAGTPMTTSAPTKPEGLYDSVYNVGWHHVVEVPGGEGMGMVLREGEPPQSWTYKKVGDTLEKDDGVEQSGAALPRLMVLTSDKGWPYSWNRWNSGLTNDCYVNCEVDRVWQIVKNDLTKWFSSHGRTINPPGRRLLIGTPGIGKSMAASSYLLYHLLHYDAKQLQMIAYFFADRTFLFDKTAQTVTEYVGESSTLDVVKGLSHRGVRGFIIYDVATNGCQPSSGLPCEGWGMIVVTSPNSKQLRIVGEGSGSRANHN